MRKYSAYKDSGVEWIGEIPEDWQINRLANFGKFLKGRGITKADLTDNGVQVILYGDIYTKYDLYAKKLERKTSYENAKRAIEIHKGDLLFTASGETKEDIGKCIVFLGEDKAYASGDVIIFRQLKNNSMFLAYVFNSYNVNIQKARLSKGEIVVHIYASQLRNIHFALPPFDEQTQIANYLDQKTTEIETLIAKKEQLIKLLEEERTAMINQAVTKGLDPNVPMKESGIDWLGKIPEHWEVARVKHFTKKIGSGVTPRGGAEVYQDAGVPLLRSQNIYFDGLKLDNVAFISNEIHDSMNNSKVLKGDVLLNITGGSIGRCYYLSDEYKEVNVNQHVCIIRPNSRISTKYLYLLISSEIGQNQIRICQQGGNREALNFEQLKGFPFALPSIQEQLKIIEVIDNKKEVMDHSVNKVTQEINLLKEYKTALISEVVTGKIDIRQEVLN